MKARDEAKQPWVAPTDPPPGRRSPRYAGLGKGPLDGETCPIVPRSWGSLAPVHGEGRAFFANSEMIRDL